MVTGRLKVRPKVRRGSAIAWLGVAALLGIAACADIWGFDDLHNSQDGGIGGIDSSTVIDPGGGGGGPGGIGGGAGSDGSGGAAGPGGGGSGGALITDAGVSDARDAMGAGGRTGTGGAPVNDAGPSDGRDAAVGVGGRIGTGGASGTGGVSGVGGAMGVGGLSGAGGAPVVCGPSNCANGCCAAGRCVTATSALQCGTGGGACTACGGCQICGANGACAISPTSNWIVRCASAQLTVLPPTGLTWDPVGVVGDGPAPDPFCQFEMPAGVIDATTGAATRNVLDSFTATWNQTVTPVNGTITAAELMSANADDWRVWVGDTEFDGRGTLACQVRPPLAASALINGQLTVTNVQNCVSFTVTLVCQP
jgi:hypothetical protein